VNAGLLTAAFGLGAGVIALWIDVRFPRLAPEEMAKALLHVGISIAAGYATGPVLQMLLAFEDGRVTLAAVFGLAFPAVVYCLLSGIWMIKLAQRMLSGYLR
jgi:uncharacterized membrane protein